MQGHLLESLVLFPALLPLIAAVIVTVVHLIRPMKHAPRTIVWLIAATAALMVGNWVWKAIAN